MVVPNIGRVEMPPQPNGSNRKVQTSGVVLPVAFVTKDSISRDTKLNTPENKPGVGGGFR